MSNNFSRAEQGFSLLELLLAVGVMAMVIVGVAALISRQSDDAKANVVALQLKTIGDAASEYIKDNYSTIYTNTQAANSKAIITLPMLTASGYLGADFAQKNAYNQDTCVVVRHSANSSNDLLGLVVTEGGNAIDDVTLGQIAATVGGAGGGVYSANTSLVRGALGAWTFNTNVFSGATTTGANCSGGGNITLAAGHPTMSLWFADGASRSASGTLYRNAVAGQPELNTMNTPLIMGVPTIQAAGSVCTTNGAIARDTSGAVLSCVSGKWANAGSSYWGDPTDTIAGLGSCDASKAGATRMVKSAAGAAFNAHPYVPYTCDGTGTWKAVAIDQAGNLSIAGNFGATGDISGSSGHYSGGLWSRSLTTDYANITTLDVPGVSHFRNTAYFDLGGLVVSGAGVLRANGGIISQGTLVSNGPAVLNGTSQLFDVRYFQLNNVANIGGRCVGGSLAREESGGLLSCDNGVWRKASGGEPRLSYYSREDYANRWTYTYIGYHDLCVSVGGNENNTDDSWRVVENYNSDANGRLWRIGVKNGAQRAYCLDW